MAIVIADACGLSPPNPRHMLDWENNMKTILPTVVACAFAAILLFCCACPYRGRRITAIAGGRMSGGGGANEHKRRLPADCWVNCLQSSASGSSDARTRL